MFLLCVFRQDNQPCDIMEQSQTVTISCVSSNKISHPINFMLQYLPTCSTFLHYFHPWFVSLISLSLSLFLQNPGSCHCDQNANTSGNDRNRLSPCQPNPGNNPHLQLFPDNQWEGRCPLVSAITACLP